MLKMTITKTNQKWYYFAKRGTTFQTDDSNNGLCVHEVLPSSSSFFAVSLPPFRKMAEKYQSLFHCYKLSFNKVLLRF